MKHYIIVLICTLTLTACQTTSDSNLEQEVPTPPVEETQKEVLEFAPATYLGNLIGAANGIEATMYSAGASFSVYEKSSVEAFLSLISLNTPKSNSKNQVGHIMFLQDGENILLASVYHNGSDVFMRIDDKEAGKRYYNVLTGKARDLFINLNTTPVEQE